MKKIKDFKIRVTEVSEWELLETHLWKLVGKSNVTIDAISFLSELADSIFEEKKVKGENVFVISKEGKVVLSFHNHKKYSSSKLPEFTLYDFLQYQGEPVTEEKFEGTTLDDMKKDPCEGKKESSDSPRYTEVYQVIFHPAVRPIPLPNTPHMVIIKELNANSAKEEFKTYAQARESALKALAPETNFYSSAIKFSIKKYYKVVL